MNQPVNGTVTGGALSIPCDGEAFVGMVTVMVDPDAPLGPMMFQLDGFGPGSATCSATATVEVEKWVDLIFGPVNEDDEEDPGGFLCLNDDDDDNNGQDRRTLSPLCRKDLNQELVVPPSRFALPFDAVL
ncbi:MAG: hypothetical protein ACE5E5_15370 [Phycisphaerae bacterium]